MTSRLYPKTPLIGACTAIWRGDKVLLAKRSRPPLGDKWAMPGGLVEVGESLAEAAIRETYEETSLHIKAPIFNRFHELIRKDAENRIEMHYVLAMFAAQCDEGSARAGDDAEDVGWFSLHELQSLTLTPNTLELVTEGRDLLYKRAS